MAISSITLVRSVQEPGGRRYLTWRIALPNGRTIDHGPVLVGDISDQEMTDRVAALMNDSLARAELQANIDEGLA